MIPLTQEQRDNLMRFKTCRRHDFKLVPKRERMAMNRPYVCVHCGGNATGHARKWYEEGLRHATALA